MSSKLNSDVHYAYMSSGAAWECLSVKADIMLFAGNTVWSISEHFRGVCVLYKYICVIQIDVTVTFVRCHYVQHWCQCRRRSAVAAIWSIGSVLCTSQNQHLTTVSMVSCHIRRHSTWATTAHCTTWQQPIRLQRRRTVITLWFQQCRLLTRRQRQRRRLLPVVRIGCSECLL